MLPYSRKIFLVVGLLIGILIFPIYTLCSSGGKEDSPQDHLSGSLKAFGIDAHADDEATRTLLELWSNYLEERTHFSSADYLEAIESQQLDYYKAINLLNKRITDTNNFRNDYTSRWLKDLNRKFGPEFIVGNREAILHNFAAIISRSYHQYGKELKDLVYIETMLYGSYKEYFNSFMKFYEDELSPGDQVKLKARKDVAETLLNLIGEASITLMHENLVLSERMNNNRARKHSKELFEFFDSHSLSKFFEISKASDDLDAAIQNYKNQK